MKLQILLLYVFLKDKRNMSFLIQLDYIIKERTLGSRKILPIYLAPYREEVLTEIH